MKYLIFDSGPLISLSMNGLLNVLEELKKVFSGEFIITPHVKKEVIDRPITIKKYELEALKVEDLIQRGILRNSSDFISNQRLEKETKKISKQVNSAVKIIETGEKIKILHSGEASCIAFADLCGCENVLVIDERTTRLLIESPKNLEELMEKKLHSRIGVDLDVLKYFKRFKLIRSSELLFIAYKKNILPFHRKNKQLLDALLYGVKFKGTAISSREIEEMKKMV